MRSTPENRAHERETHSGERAFQSIVLVASLVRDCGGYVSSGTLVQCACAEPTVVHVPNLNQKLQVFELSPPVVAVIVGVSKRPFPDYVNTHQVRG